MLVNGSDGNCNTKEQDYFEEYEFFYISMIYEGEGESPSITCEIAFPWNEKMRYT